jgi:hypothetical protein
VASFTFAGTTIVAPGFILRSTIGTQRVLQLLPFGTICMVGASDGGLGGGTVYRFNNINQAQQVLRGGPLLQALQTASNIGGASGLVGVVVGAKTPGTLVISGGTGDFATGTVTVGGTWATGDVANITLSGHLATYTTLVGDTTDALIAQHLAAALQTVITANSIAAQVQVIGAAIHITSTVSGTPGELTLTATKTSTSGTITASGAALAFGSVAATFTAGDEGTWTNAITVAFATGTSTGFMFTMTYPDPITGQTLSIGGAKTAFDNLPTLSALATAMLNNSLITPAAGTGYQPLLSLVVTADGLPANMTATPLTGGTGSGAQALTFSDYKVGVDNLVDESFDIGHLVGAYDQESQAYADEQAQMLYPLGYLRTWVHQCVATGAASNQTKVQNSAAVVSAGVAAAQALNSSRSSMCAQKLSTLNPALGTFTFVDAAWVYCGQIALTGATGANGPASPMTYDYPSTVADVDYQVLKPNGDQDAAILGGLVVFERVSTAGAGSVRIVQSVTTAPNDASGAPWIFSELSVVRVSDALLANVKAFVEQASPKVLGGGNTVKVQAHILSVVRDILEAALTSNWITGFDPASVTIGPSGNLGTDDVVAYSAAPTLPLNHLAVDQTLIPFQVPVSVGGTVNG